MKSVLKVWKINRSFFIIPWLDGLGTEACFCTQWPRCPDWPIRPISIHCKNNWTKKISSSVLRKILEFVYLASFPLPKINSACFQFSTSHFYFTLSNSCPLSSWLTLYKPIEVSQDSVDYKCNPNNFPIQKHVWFGSVLIMNWHQELDTCRIYTIVVH